MSLQIRDPRSRGRSKSPSGRDRDRSRSRDSRVPSPPKEKTKKVVKKYYESDSSESDRHKDRKKSSKKYYESDSDDRSKHAKKDKKSSKKHDSDSSESDRHRDKSKKSSKKHYDSDSDSSEGSPRHRHPGAPEPPRSHRDPYAHPSYAQPAQYNYGQPGQYAQPPPGDYHATRHMSYADAKHDQWGNPIPETQRPGLASPTQDRNLSLNTSGNFNVSIGGPKSPRPQYAPPTQQQYAPPGAFPYGHTDVPDHERVHSISSPPGQQYVPPQRYEYARVDPNIKYKSKSEKQYTQSHEPQLTKPYTQSHETQYVEIKPGGRLEKDKYEKEKRSKYGSPPSDGLAPRMHSLSVSGGSALTVATQGHGDGGKPPASPLLEAYRGTYQSISPMPSPIMIGGKYDDDLSDFDLDHSSDSDGHGRKPKHKKEGERPRPPHRKSSETAAITVISPTTARKRVAFYDATSDAKTLAAALSHSRVDPKPLIAILPNLSTDDILELRNEYKNHAKMAGKGINIAKHIKVKVTGNLGKVAYATALGRWESEAYWANSWYQSGSSRRELLIESLMGRTNSDIREIKNSFSDKRYSDSLEKCMKAELKADKFRSAILLALEEKRMSDSQPLSMELVKRDVQDLNRALTSREGGETAMIQVLVVRSDSHIREVMHVYEANYRKNFAREMIAKSRNLVGETLTHIINGALNRPMRDALLVHQAIAESGTGKDRAELLISRIVRLHWEPKHLERVKHEYRKRYGVKLEDKIEEEVGKGSEWGDFCIELAKSSSR